MERQETFTTPGESEITQLQTESEPQVDEPEAVVQVVDPTKLNYEVQQGYRIFRELLSDPYRTITYPFLEPVDAESMGLWDYHERIKEPMCFTTIGSKFNNYEYKSITEVISDLRLILENCYRYNGADHWVSKQGQKVEKVLEQKCALLNRSLREKVTLSATMAVRGNYCIEALAESSSGRRRSGRNSYLSSLKGENTSLVTQMKIQKEYEERERRKQREKVKKEANEALLQELTEWEESELTAETIKHLHSMWEIPSVGSMLYLMKEILNLQDISFSEFELSFIYPNKSSLLARIFTALLLTPHQRKSLNNKPAMKFKVWQEKLRGRLALWHKYLEKDGADFAAQQFGLDTRYFEILGEKNPLEENSYDSLTLHKRVWILKSLVDSCLYLDADFRGQLNTVAAADQRELLLGFDANNWSYLYFPMLCSTDIRIYRQGPLPTPSLRKRKKIVTASSKSESPAKSAAAAPSTPRHPRLRKLRNDLNLSESEPSSPKSSCEEDIKQNENCSVEEGFEAACYDVDTLKQLCEKFAELPPPPKRRGRKPKPPPPRKRCEVDLHQTFEAMWEELEKFESKFTKFRTKAKIKLMKESQEIDVQEETAAVEVKEEGEEKEDDYGSEESAEENSDSEEEETGDEESESVDENTADDTAKPLAWKHKLGIAIAEAGGSPGSPAVSEDGVEPLPKKVKKQRKNAPLETEDTANVTVSVSAAEAVQALVNFPSPSSNTLPSTPTSSGEAVGNLSADTDGKPVEKPKAEGVAMALRTKARTTPQRTLVVPTISASKSSSRSNTGNSLSQPTAGASTGSSCSGVGADFSVSQVKIPAVLIQHGIVKMRPPKPKVKPLPVESHITTTSESGQHMEDQMTTSSQSTAMPSANVVPTTAVISSAVRSHAHPSAIVKKTVLVFSQSMDIETTGQLTPKSSTTTLAAPPRSSIAQGEALSPAMFDTGHSTALKQILAPTRTSSVNVPVSLTPLARQKMLVLPSSKATSMPLLSKSTAASKLLQKTSLVPVGVQKRTVLKKVPTTAGERATQLVGNPQSVSTSPSSITTATLAASKPSTVALGGTTLSSKLVVTPTAMSASRAPTTSVEFLSSGSAAAPASIPVVHRQQPMASAGRLQPQHTSRVIGGPTVNTSITSQSVSKSGNIMPTPAIKVLLPVSTSAQTQTVGAKYLPATLQAVQHLCVPKVNALNVSGGVSSTIPRVSSTAATSTIRLLTQPAGSQSVQPIGQVSSVARTVVSRPIATFVPSAKASKGPAPHTSTTMPLAFVATTTIAQLLEHTHTPSPATTISVPSALLAKLPQQPTVQKEAGISTLPVHSPVVVRHLLKEFVTPVTTTTATQSVAARSKQYALSATAGKVVTTSIATTHSRPDTLQKAVKATTPQAETHSNQHPASTRCVTTVMSSPVTLTHCKQAELQASVATTSPVPGTHTKQYAANTNVMPSPIEITHSKALPPIAGAAVSPLTGAQCKQHAESVKYVTTVPGSSRASEEASPPNIHRVSSEGRVPTEQRTDSTTIAETASAKMPAVKQSTISSKDQPEGRTVRGCTKSSDHSPSTLLASHQTKNVKPADSNCTTQDKTNGCSNTASMKNELSSSVLVGGSPVSKRSANCINGDLGHIPRKKCKGDDTPNGTFSNVIAEEKCTASSTELEHSASTKTFISTSGNNASKETSPSKSGNAEAETNSLDICNGVVTAQCEKLVDAEMDQLKSTENCCLKTFCNGLTVEHAGKESTNH